MSKARWRVKPDIPKPKGTGMKFSQTPPTEPGLYWFKLVEDSNIHHCRVWYSPDYNALCAAAGDSYKPVTKFGRWWSVEFLPYPESEERG